MTPGRIIFVSVFHMKLDFKNGVAFLCGPFFFGVKYYPILSRPLRDLSGGHCEVRSNCAPLRT